MTFNCNIYRYKDWSTHLSWSSNLLFSFVVHIVVHIAYIMQSRWISVLVCLTKSYQRSSLVGDNKCRSTGSLQAQAYLHSAILWRHAVIMAIQKSLLFSQIQHAVYRVQLLQLVITGQRGIPHGRWTVTSHRAKQAPEYLSWSQTNKDERRSQRDYKARTCGDKL